MTYEQWRNMPAQVASFGLYAQLFAKANADPVWTDLVNAIAFSAYEHGKAEGMMQTGGRLMGNNPTQVVEM